MTLKKILSPISVLSIFLITFMPGQALGSDSAFLGGYQIQVFADPDPPVAKKETTITVKILHADDLTPARRADVLIGAKEKLQDITSKGLDLKDIAEYQNMKEADQFGDYEWKTTFPEPDTYYIKVAIKGMDGKVIGRPVAAGFTIAVNPPNRPSYRLLVIFIALLITTFGAIYLIHVKKNNLPEDPKELNLLDILSIRKLLQWRYIQTVFQVPMSIFLGFLILLAMIDIQDAGTNLASILIWTVWWAGIVFTFVLVGRLWCFMCPVGAISEWISRIFKPIRIFPAGFRNVWFANIMFLLLTWLDIQVGVVRHPVVTGSLLIGITALAIVVGLLFQRRSFCRYLCPIGGLIGIYSMFSAVELRSKDFEVCRSHKRKECYLGNEKGRGCPMFEMIPTMDSNNLCTFCGECIKSCPKDNLTLRIRPFFKDAWTTRKRCLDEAALAIVLVGISIFVTGDMLEPWKGWMESAMKMIPSSQLGIEYRYTAELITKSILYFSVSLLIIPGLMLLASAISNRLVRKENHHGLKQTFITFGYMFIPIGLSLHLAHNLGHLLNESGKVIPAFQRVINTFTPFNIGGPNWRLAAQPLIDASLLYWIQMGLFLVFYIFSLYAGYRLAMNNYKNARTAFRALIPMILLSFLLMIVNVYLLNLPMAPRHVH
jgi:polyferredoxin